MIDVDDTFAVVENSGQRVQAVAKFCAVRLLYVPIGQSTTSPAVHHLPLGQTEDAVRVTVPCDGAEDAVTVTDVPSAVPRDAPSVASLTFSTLERRSATGEETGVPSAAVPVVAIVIVSVIEPLL